MTQSVIIINLRYYLVNSTSLMLIQYWLKAVCLTKSHSLSFSKELMLCFRANLLLYKSSSLTDNFWDYFSSESHAIYRKNRQRLIYNRRNEYRLIVHTD